MSTIKHKFKVGDRVVAYGNSLSGPSISGHGWKGTITYIGAHVQVERADGSYMGFHPKQCRHLKPPTKPPEPRRVWITEGSISSILKDSTHDCLVSANKIVKNDVEFVEIVRPGKSSPTRASTRCDFPCNVCDGTATAYGEMCICQKRKKK